MPRTSTQSTAYARNCWSNGGTVKSRLHDGKVNHRALGQSLAAAVTKGDAFGVPHTRCKILLYAACVMQHEMRPAVAEQAHIGLGLCLRACSNRPQGRPRDFALRRQRQASMSSQISDAPVLVQPSWLADRLDRNGSGTGNNVRVLDASWYLPSMGVLP